MLTTLPTIGMPTPLQRAAEKIETARKNLAAIDSKILAWKRTYVTAVKSLRPPEYVFTGLTRMEAEAQIEAFGKEREAAVQAFHVALEAWAALK